RRRTTSHREAAGCGRIWRPLLEIKNELLLHFAQLAQPPGQQSSLRRAVSQLAAFEPDPHTLVTQRRKQLVDPAHSASPALLPLTVRRLPGPSRRRASHARQNGRRASGG